MKVSLRGKGRSAEAKSFKASALENLIEIKHDLINHTYQLLPYRELIVTEPKRRVIKCGAFRDKILQHCLCDYVLLPRMKDVFIYDNAAGQIGKGTLFGLNRLSEHLLSFYEQYGCDGYILKCDITKFFYSIDHDVMKSKVKKYFDDPDILWLCDLLIDSVEGKGLPLGNQASQVFALMYLADLDNLIVNECGFQWYGRYMDDFYVVSHDKDKLKELLVIVREHLQTLGLTLNGKTEIVPIRKGIRYLGFHTYLTENGLIIRRLIGEQKRRYKKRLLKLIKLVKSGKLSEKKFNEIFDSMKNHLSHGSCYKLICDLDRFVSDSMKENQDGQQKGVPIVQ